MIGEIAHFLSLAAVLLLSLVLIFNLLFFFNKIHPNQLTLSMRLFNQACWLVFISFGMYMYLAVSDDFSIAYMRRSRRFIRSRRALASAAATIFMRSSSDGPFLLAGLALDADVRRVVAFLHKKFIE